MSEAITKALQDVIAAHDHGLAIMGEQMRDAGVTALTIGGPDGEAALKMFEAISAARAALSKPAPSPQPAVPVAGEREKAEADAALYGTGFIVDGWRVAPHRVHILALRPAVEPMTEWEIADIFERWDNTSGASMSDFVRMVEAHHGITAKAEDAHQPTKEAEKTP